MRGHLVEVWQANAAGRYAHQRDQHPAPLDPNFTGAGRCLTGDDGGYRFVTIKPGAYPWRNHANAWRPAHIHFSVFGTAFTQRLVTQMYFPGDPLFAHDPILRSIADERPGTGSSRVYDHDRARVGARLPVGHRARRAATRWRREMTARPGRRHAVADRRPVLRLRAALPGGGEVAPAGHPDAITVHGRVLDGRAPRSRTRSWRSGSRTRRVAPGRPAPCAATPSQGGAPAGTAWFTGFGRVPTDADGHWAAAPSPRRAPAARPVLLLAVFARGLLHHLYTRAYLPEHADARRVTRSGHADAERRATLLARRERHALYRFDIRLQGEDETVFLEFPYEPRPPGDVRG